MMKHTAILILSLLCASCASYKDTFPAYTNAKVEIARAQALADAAYYQMLTAQINANARIKEAALARGNAGSSVVFIGADSSMNMAPVHKAVDLAAPDPAPGAKYALEFGKAAVYSGAAAFGLDSMFRTFRNLSGTANNISTTYANTSTETRTTDKSVSVSDSGNRTDNSDNSVTRTVSDSGNTDNSINTGDVDLGDKDNSVNTADSNNDMSDNSDNSDQSDNSDNSDNSTHDNDNSTENILPATPEAEISP
jgi:hypothetical protein